ncbi:hypothetical protein [uncultured Tateyamaria sp.]|uniref:hypothetical protein n=1 Tax=uncultured Tateyamaria sp. TaxID=455651 RepID=UPI00260450D5|nr:hypothetical protein [uncultured Tateyamaria sp.]
MTPLQNKGISIFSSTRQILILAGVLGIALVLTLLLIPNRSPEDVYRFKETYSRSATATNSTLIPSWPDLPIGCIIAKNTQAGNYGVARTERFWNFVSAEFSLVGNLTRVEDAEHCEPSTNFYFFFKSSIDEGATIDDLNMIGAKFADEGVRDAINPLAYGFGYLDGQHPKAAIFINDLSSTARLTGVVERFINAAVIQETFQMLLLAQDKPIEGKPSSILHEPVWRENPDWSKLTINDIATFLDQTPEKLCGDDVFALAVFEKIVAAEAFFMDDVQKTINSSLNSIRKKATNLSNKPNWSDVVSEDCSLK